MNQVMLNKIRQLEAEEDFLKSQLQAGAVGTATQGQH